ncbi:PREDICTED: uncharacterized protein LOC105562437 isoform X1 [Vollenhovia emeryi]|uniref:uncharacterized protein LOC105562437 isoform X1 n=1 Tax=Vollenhovia emeryi TaxID=411798 RepID=UPI0005F4E8AB|nr:PREDICTED: uncharacterized protein LOC105562437 isoform X1 [Vollenhovia emeryi]
MKRAFPCHKEDPRDSLRRGRHRRGGCQYSFPGRIRWNFAFGNNGRVRPAPRVGRAEAISGPRKHIGVPIVLCVWINWTIKERVSECRRADKVNAHTSVTLAGQTQREQTSKPEVTFVRIAWESEAELVDELENCLHPRRPA